MRILIIGAGQVGASLAENLVAEKHDITIIDPDQKKLNDLEQRLDIHTVQGVGAHPSTLERANISATDLLIAVSHHDETNMIACQIAYSLFNVPTRIARLRTADYSTRPELFTPKVIPISHTISPETVVTQHFKRLIDYPGSSQVLDFAAGKILLLTCKIRADNPFVDQSIADIKKSLPIRDVRIAAVFRREIPLAITDALTIMTNDEILFVCKPAHAHKITKCLKLSQQSNRRIMIAGGGNIGTQIAKSLESDYQVKLIDHNTQRSKVLAEVLDKTTILFGDAADRDILVNENIDYMDVFCAVTNDDEANIMSCILAKQLGAKQTLALINRSEYLNLVEANLVDVAISPQQITIGNILTHIRHGDLVQIHSIRRGIAEAIEIIAHGDQATSKVIGRSVDEIKWPHGVVVAAICRGDEVFITHKSLTIEANDHVILVVKNKQMISDIESLFQVDIGFFN